MTELIEEVSSHMNGELQGGDVNLNKAGDVLKGLMDQCGVVNLNKAGDELRISSTCNNIKSEPETENVCETITVLDNITPKTVQDKNKGLNLPTAEREMTTPFARLMRYFRSLDQQKDLLATALYKKPAAHRVSKRSSWLMVEKLWTWLDHPSAMVVFVLLWLTFFGLWMELNVPFFVLLVACVASFLFFGLGM